MKIYHVSNFTGLKELYLKLVPKMKECLVVDKKCEIDGIKIMLVDGDKIKTECNMDFVEGGHDLVYDFMPSKTIWIDKNIRPEEYPYIALHEYLERFLMVNYKMEYNSAHTLANCFEKSFRVQC